ncbi:MAG TPA: response regulator [Aggregatilineales bacterium]|nr:response regulator [Aggregatilineales bacterium]
MGAMSVLVVDDEKDIRELLRIAFLTNGYEVFTATNGVEALESIRQEQPSAVLLDLMMPHMSGYEVVESLRDEGLLDLLPIVILTARNIDETDQGRLEGVRAVYQKGATDLNTLVKDLSVALA